MNNPGITADYNPLLEIDTSFASYLNARTRSFKDHIVKGMIDYAFGADFPVKQKITSFSGWSKIYKTVTGRDIPGKVKKAFQSADAAGPLKYPEVYDAVNLCAERLQMSVPAVYVRKTSGRPDICSLSGDGIEPLIIATTSLIENCTLEELRFLIGCECGRLQNEHSTLIMCAPYFGVAAPYERESILPESEITGISISNTMRDWLKLADVTSDRAGIICLNDPNEYPKVMASLYEKGLFRHYNCNEFDIDGILQQYDVLRKTPVRSMVIPTSCSALDKRVFAGLEFTSCDVLYSWRGDLNKSDIHTVNKQAMEVRCEIFLDAAKEGE